MPEWVVQLLVAGAIYGGIRADLIHVKQQIERAHERIDNILGVKA